MGDERDRGRGKDDSSLHRSRQSHSAGRQPRQPCHFFATTKGFRNGNSCPFLHPQTNGSSGNSSSSVAAKTSSSSASSVPLSEPPPPFSYLIRRTDRIRNQHDMRRLVLSALQERDVAEVLLAWTDKQNPDRLTLLRSLLEERYVIDAGWHAKSVSFQRVLVPLITLLASDRIANTAHASCWKVMLSVVSGQVQHFIPRAIMCIEQLTTGGQLEIEKRIEAAAVSDVAYVVTRWEEMALPFVDLLYRLSSQVTDFAAEHAERLAGWCERFNTVVQRCSANSAVGTRKANTAIARIRTILNNTLVVERMVKELGVRKEERKQREGWLSAAPRANASPDTVSADEMSGELRAGGGRHDNDKSDFRLQHPSYTAGDDVHTASLPPLLASQPAGAIVLCSQSN